VRNNAYQNKIFIGTILKLLKQSKANSVFAECPDEIINITSEFENSVCLELQVHILNFIMSPCDSRDQLFRDFIEQEGIL